MFLLNMQSKVPIYLQIEQQIIRLMEAGVLKPGDKLPSVRALAVENGINPNTVAKAYAELEQQGYVCNLPKKGVYASERMPRSSKEEELLKMLRSFKEQGISEEMMINTVHKLYEEDSDAEN